MDRIGRKLPLVAMAIGVAAACAAPPGHRSAQAPAPPAGPPPAAATDVPAAILGSARALLAKALAHDGIASPAVLEAAERVTWRDGSLGCGRPGTAATQVLTPGYRLVFSAGGRRYEYHAAAKGTVIACQRPFGGWLESPPAPDPADR